MCWLYYFEVKSTIDLITYVKPTLNICSCITVQNVNSIYLLLLLGKAGIMSLIYSLVRVLSMKPISGTSRRAATEPLQDFATPAFWMYMIDSLVREFYQNTISGTSRRAATEQWRKFCDFGLLNQPSDLLITKTEQAGVQLFCESGSYKLYDYETVSRFCGWRFWHCFNHYSMVSVHAALLRLWLQLLVLWNENLFLSK